jgi:hypothetical protein
MNIPLDQALVDVTRRTGRAIVRGVVVPNNAPPNNCRAVKPSTGRRMPGFANGRCARRSPEC